MDPLAQLNDIVELDHVSAWPLAWGWWLLLALLLLTLITCALWYIQTRRKTALLRTTKKNIAQCSSVAEVSTQLKIVALHYFAHSPTLAKKSIEQLSGVHWLHFLNWQLPAKHQFTAHQLNDIAAVMYSANSQQQFASYQAFAALWLKHAAITRGHTQYEGQSHV